MKIIILHILKMIGIFNVAKRYYRNSVLILAYHGFEIADESEFSPKLFMKRSTLNERMMCLKEKGFHVVSLDEAIKTSDLSKLPKNSIVITVDDGWYSTLSEAHEIFSHYSFPYTLYVTTYYVDKGSPVLNVALRYIIWKTNLNSIVLDLLEEEGLKGTYLLTSFEKKQHVERVLSDYLNTLSSHEKKINFVSRLGVLFIDHWECVVKQRSLSFLSKSELLDMTHKGVDIQLHTHRHTIPHEDVKGLKKEIIQNRMQLEAPQSSRKIHFCYPSGRYRSDSGAALKNLGIRSATTCDPGFVSKQSDPYYLPRFLDAEDIPLIVFEAEIHGVLEFLRKLKNFMVSAK